MQDATVKKIDRIAGTLYVLLSLAWFIWIFFNRLRPDRLSAAFLGLLVGLSFLYRGIKYTLLHHTPWYQRPTIYIGIGESMYGLEAIFFQGTSLEDPIIEFDLLFFVAAMLVFLWNSRRERQQRKREQQSQASDQEHQ